MDTYAVISTGGKQYRVGLGDVLEVELLEPKNGKVVFDSVLLVQDDGKVKVGTPTLDGIKVMATVVEDAKKGQKIKVFKFKAKSRYRKNRGHRQTHTVVRIDSIGDKKFVEAKPKAEKKEAKKEATAKKTVKTTKKTTPKKTK